MEPSAKIIADSISPDGVRLTTFEITIHRFVLAEFNTHRTLSRNSASSRAIPVSKQLRRVKDDPAMPVVWPLEQAGMQGGGEASTRHAESVAESWLEARDESVLRVEAEIEFSEQLFSEKPVHKSVLNRLLEPWMSHTIICTATAWENFFLQRCHPAAQPEIRAVAEKMEHLYRHHEPGPLDEGEWHLPYLGDDDTETWLQLRAYDRENGGKEDPDVLTQACVKVSAARCARVSYLTHDGKRDIQADLDLYDRLTDRQKDAAHANDPIHWSPLEHVATPWAWNRQEGCIHFGQDPEADHDTFTCVPLDHLPRVGNLLGWRSLRTTVEAEQGAVTYR